MPTEPRGGGGDERPARGSVSVRAQLSRALLLVLLIALLPSVVAIQYLRSIETLPSASNGSAAESDAPEPGSEAAFTLTERATRNTITFAVLAAFAGALVVIYAPVVLLKTLGRVTSILKQAEAGNLNVAVAGSRIREVSSLAIAVNRTLGRLRHYDALKTRRIREEQRLVEALFAAGERGLALVSPQAKIVRRNGRFRELVERGDQDCSGRTVRDVLGDEAHDLVRRVQREREVESLAWSPGEGEATRRIMLSPVKDEVDTPPRVLLAVEPGEPGGG